MYVCVYMCMCVYVRMSVSAHELTPCHGLPLRVIATSARRSLLEVGDCRRARPMDSGDSRSSQSAPFAILFGFSACHLSSRPQTGVATSQFNTISRSVPWSARSPRPQLNSFPGFLEIVTTPVLYSFGESFPAKRRRTPIER